MVTYSQVDYNSRLIGWLVSHLGRSAWISQAVYDKSQVKGELEWKVGKWAGVPVRPGIAHWERRERMGAKESEVEEKEKGGTQGEGKGEGHHEELEEGLGAVAISEGGEPKIQEGLKPESPAPQVNLVAMHCTESIGPFLGEVIWPFTPTTQVHDIDNLIDSKCIMIAGC